MSKELRQTICENKGIKGDTTTEEIINDGSEIEEDFVEKYLEPFLLSLGDDPEFCEDIKKSTSHTERASRISVGIVRMSLLLNIRMELRSSFSAKAAKLA